MGQGQRQDRSRSDGDRAVSRRRALSSIAAASFLPLLSTGPRSDRAELRVRVYPGVAGSATRWGGWDAPAVEAYGAVADALERVATNAADDVAGLETVEWSVEAGAGVALPDGMDFGGLVDRFRGVVRDRDAGSGETCHLLLCRKAMNHTVGYGGLGGPNRHVADALGEGAYAVVNVGATERWDDRTVTRNMAVHETLHAFLTDDVVESVVGTGCDHHLGAARHVDDDTAEVTPMATAYAGERGVESETAWHGSGCGDREAFYRHDGVEGIERWRHVPDLTDATLEATALYADRHL